MAEGGKKTGGGMTENVKMKLRKNDMKISKWSILKTFIILLFLLEIATLMVTFKREEICVSDFSCS
jgi:hypothetical protein